MDRSCLRERHVDASRVSGTGIGLVRVVRWEPTDEGRHSLVAKEWLVTNGLGGYASGTRLGRVDAPLPRVSRRRAADAVRPHGDVELRLGAAPLSGRTAGLAAQPDRHARVARNSTRRDGSSSFRLEAGLPVWTFDVEGVRFEKRVLMPHLQNTTHITYRLLSNRAGAPGAAATRRVPPARGAGQSSGRRRRTACTRSAIASSLRLAEICRRCGCSCTARTRRSP